MSLVDWVIFSLIASVAYMFNRLICFHFFLVQELLKFCGFHPGLPVYKYVDLTCVCMISFVCCLDACMCIDHFPSRIL